MADRSGFGTIVVGVDGTPASLEAVRWTADLAKRTGARVMAVTATTPFEDLIRDSVHVQPGNWRAELRTRLHDEWGAALAEAGVDYSSRLIGRHPGAALISAAQDEDATLLVVGVHRHRHLGGSLSSHLTRHAPCPVVAVPTTKPAPAVSPAEELATAD